MTRSTVRWTLAATTAALLTLPAPSLAQTSPPPTTPPASSTPTQDVPSAAQEHLRQARTALDDIKTASVDARARTHVNDINKRLMALERFAGINDSASPKGQASRSSQATATRGKVNWGTEVAAIDKALTTLLGPAQTAGAAGTTNPPATGTSGSAASKSKAGVTLDAETRTKLEEVRTHITAFATAMAGGKTTPQEPAAADPASSAASSASGSTASGTGSPTSSPTTTGATGTTGSAASASPAQSQPQTDPQPPATNPASQVNEEAARRHLTEARNTLSAMTQLPAAAQLSGEARTHVSQLITNFNELITAQSEWRAAYAKVEANLTALLGPDPAASASGTIGTTGTTGTTGTVGTSGAAGAELDPAVREKLVELRRNLNEFEKAAGGTADPSASSPSTTGAAAATSGTATSATTGTSGTSGTAASDTSPTPQTTGAQTTEGSNAEVMRHVAAIEALLKMQDDSGGLTLTKTQVEQLRTHWAALKQVLERK